MRVACEHRVRGRAALRALRPRPLAPLPSEKCSSIGPIGRPSNGLLLPSALDIFPSSQVGRLASFCWESALSFPSVLATCHMI